MADDFVRWKCPQEEFYVWAHVSRGLQICPKHEGEYMELSPPAETAAPPTAEGA